MKLKQISFKIVSLVMVITLLFSICATTISAATWQHADHTHETEKDKIYYVSLGDSMTNGYGLDGYGDMRDQWANSGVEDYGYGSYANIFAEWLATEMGWTEGENISDYVDHAQLAMSGIRIEDVHFLLEFDYNDRDLALFTESETWDEAAWNERFTTGDYWTWHEILNHSRTDYTTYAILNTGYDAYPEGYDPADPYNGDVALIAKYFQEHVKEADIISLGVGNGNFGVFAMGRIMEAIGFSGTPSQALVYNVESAIRELSPEMQNKILALKAELEVIMTEILAESGHVGESAEALINTLVYVGISFVINYMGTVDAIVELNPDADIICLALMNTFGESDLGKFFGDELNASQIMSNATIADVLNACYTPLNAFISGYVTYLQLRDQVVKGTFIEIETLLQSEIAKIKAEADAKAAALKAEADAKVAILTEQLKNATAEAKVVIEAEIAVIKAELDAAIQEIADAADFDSQVVIDQIEEELAVAVVTNGNPLEEINEEISGYIAVLKARAAAKVAELTAKAEAEIAGLNAAILAASGETKAQLEAQLAEILAELEANVAAVNAANAIRIAEAEAELAAAVAQVQANIINKYNEDKAALEAAIAALNEQLMNATEDAKAAIEAEIAALEAAIEAAAAQAEAEIAAAVEALEAQAQKQIDTLNAQAEKQIAILRAEVETQVAIIEAELVFVTNQAKAQLATLKADAEAKYAALKAQVEAQLEVLNAQLETAVGDVKDQIELQIASVKAQYQVAVEALNAQYEAVLAQLHNAEAEFKAEVYAEIARIDAELEEAVAEINAQLTNAVAEANTVINEQLNAAVNYIIPQIDAAEAQLNDAIARVYALATEQIDALNEEALDKIAELKEHVLEQTGVSNNTFYYAEADYVECMVQVYGEEIRNPNSVVRKRMVEGVVSTVFPLVSGMFNSLLAANDMPMQIVSITADDVAEYERFAAEWAAYEANTNPDKYATAIPATTLNNNQIISCAVYLAFEDAIVNCSNADVGLGDVLGLGGDMSGLFAGVAGSMTPDALGFDVVIGSVANEIYARYGAEIQAAVEAAVMANLTAWATSAEGTATIGAWAMTAEGQAKIQAYCTANEIAAPDATTYAMAYIFMTTDGQDRMNAEIANQTAIKTAEAQAQYAPTFATRYLAPRLTAPLANAVKGDAGLSGLISLFGRCVIANGLGAHPSANGHQALAAAVIDAYENGYTSFDKTIKDAALVLLGYAYLNGYTVDATEAIDKLLAEIAKLQDAVNGYDFENPDEFAAILEALNAEIDLVEADLNAIKDIINSLEVEALLTNPNFVDEKIAEVEALYAGLEVHLANLIAIAEEAQVIAELHYDRTYTELTAQIQHQITILEAQVQHQIATLEAQVQHQIATLEAQAQAQLAILRAELETAYGEAKEAIEAEIARVEAQLAADIAALEAQAQAQLATLRAELEAAKAALIAEYEAAKAALEEQVAKQLESLEAQLAVVDGQIAALIAAGEAALLDLNAFVEAWIGCAEDFVNNLPAVYEQFVEALMKAAEYYGPEASQYVYNWLINNSDKVVAFLAQYGEVAVEFIADNAKVIFGVLAIVAVNYGEDLVAFILDNADIILPAIANWFDAYGNAMWDLIVVYLDALLAFYNISLDFNLDYEFDFGFDFSFDFSFNFNFDFDFNFDFSSLESITEAFNKIFALLGQLNNMIKSGIYDIQTALAIINELYAELERLHGLIKQFIYDQVDSFNQYVEDQINAINKYLEAQIAALTAAVAAKIAELEKAVADQIAQLIAQAQAQIDALRAQIEAQIAALQEQLKTAVGDAKAAIEAEIARLQAYLAEQIAQINAALEAQIAALQAQLEAAVAALNAFLAEQVAALEAYVAEQIANLLGYAEAQVAAIIAAIEADDSEFLAAVDSFIYNKLSRVEIELTNNSTVLAITGNEASEGVLHYVEIIAEELGINSEILTGNLRISELRDILDGTYTTDAYGQAALEGVDRDAYLAAIAGADVITVEFGMEEFTTFTVAQLMGYLYESFGELATDLVGLELGVHNVYEMDWSNFGGLIDEAMVADLLAEVRASLAAQGIGTIELMDGVSFDAIEFCTFAVECYLYAFANYVYNYGATINAIHAINPDAEVLVLGAFNPFDGFELEIPETDIVIDLSIYSELFVRALDVHTLAYALGIAKTHYVYVGGTETKSEEDGIISILDYINIDYATNTIGFNAEALDASAAGHAYIAEQILAAIVEDVTVIPPCQHQYDNACDATCNLCGEVRDVPPHVFDSCYDTECNICGFTREASEHAFSGCTDTTCYKCPYVREAGAHVYDGCLDSTCNVCGYTRIAAHTYAEVCSEECMLCDHTRVTNHTFGDWSVTKEATKKLEGEEQHTCTVCGKVETRIIPTLDGLSGGAIAGIVSGSTVIAGAGGFAAFWFVVKKKSFTDLVGAVKALVKKGA